LLLYRAVGKDQNASKGKKTPTRRNRPDSVLDKDKIQRQLQKILGSQDFQATENQRDFFHFVVSETLAKRAHEIKGYTIATRVLGRKADFDPNLDPVVSIHANKLRRALERYYLVAGQNDPVRIDIPTDTLIHDCDNTITAMWFLFNFRLIVDSLL